MVKKKKPTSEDKLQIVTFEDRSEFEETPDFKKPTRAKRPRDEWPNPEQPRYSNVNRNDERLDTRIETSTAKRLDEFLKKTGLTKKSVVDAAINRLIDSYKQYAPKKKSKK